MVTGISPDNEAFLTQAVATGQFPTREAVVDEAVRMLRSSRAADKQILGVNQKTPEQWIADLIAWSDSHPPVTHFVDDSRESIYD